VQVDPINHELKAPGTNLLTLEYDELPQIFAFKFTLCRYSEAPEGSHDEDAEGSRHNGPEGSPHDAAESSAESSPRGPAPGLKRDATVYTRMRRSLSPLKVAPSPSALVEVGRCSLTLSNPR
jgi:hypothetical protein